MISQYYRQLKKPTNVLFILLSAGYVYMSFFHATGGMYPAALYMIVVFTTFITKYGRPSYFCSTKLSTLFLGMFLVSILSFTNHTYGFPFHNRFFFGYSLIHIFCFSLTWYILYSFSLTYAQREKRIDIIILFSILFFICGIWNNIRAYSYFRIIEDSMKQHHYYYFTLQCVPLLLLRFKGIYKYLILFIVFICSIYAFKRAGLITSFGLILINMIVDSKIRIKKIFSYGIIILFIGYFTYNYLSNNENFTYLLHRLESIQEDKGSGRGDNLIAVFNEINNSSIEQILFGKGFMAMAAHHNRMVDIEIGSMVYYWGYVGLFLYAIFHILMINRLLFIKNSLSEEIRELLPSYLSCYCIFLIYAFAGEVFTYHHLFGLLFVYLGYAEGKISRIHFLMKKRHVLPINRVIIS